MGAEHWKVRVYLGNELSRLTREQQETIERIFNFIGNQLLEQLQEKTDDKVFGAVSCYEGIDLVSINSLCHGPKSLVQKKLKINNNTITMALNKADFSDIFNDYPEITADFIFNTLKTKITNQSEAKITELPDTPAPSLENKADADDYCDKMLFLIELVYNDLSKKIAIWGKDESWFDFLGVTKAPVDISNYDTANSQAVIGETNFIPEYVNSLKKGDYVYIDKLDFKYARYLINGRLVAIAESVTINDDHLGLSISDVIYPPADPWPGEKPQLENVEFHDYIAESKNNFFVLLGLNFMNKDQALNICGNNIIDLYTKLEDDLPIVYKNEIIGFCDYKVGREKDVIVISQILDEPIPLSQYVFK